MPLQSSGSTRKGAGFRFPNQKYDDSKALYTNFRYLQEYLTRLWLNNYAAPTFIVAASDSVNKDQAHFLCNGEADEVQIQRAIDECSVHGGWVHLLDGNYEFSAGLEMDSKIRLTGSGIGNTVIKAASGFSDNELINVNNESYTWVGHMSLNGNGSGKHGFSKRNVADDFVYLEAMEIYGCNFGVHFARDASRHFLNDVTSRNNTVGLWHGEGTVYAVNSAFRNNSSNGIQAGFSGMEQFYSSCHIQSNGGWGVDAQDGNTHLVDCKVHGNTSGGVRLTNSDYSQVMCCRISNNTGIGLMLGDTGVAVGNVIYSNSTNDISHGSNCAIGFNVIGTTAFIGDHGSLSGLSDDDHTQYLNVTRHDADDHSALPEAAVTQHEAALTITESQISDLDHYTDADVTALVDKDFVDALNVDADTLDGLDSTDLALSGHDHDSDYSELTHTHTESDITDLDHYTSTDFGTDLAAASIADLGDVADDAPDDNDFLQWNASTSMWEPVSAGSGVTGGDAHDHSGGDGAQIDHGGLAGLTDDDHPQYLLREDMLYAEFSSSNTSFANATNQDMTWSAVSDANNWLTSSTEITPSTAGRYQIVWQFNANQNWSGARIRGFVQINGVSHPWEIDEESSATGDGKGFVWMGEYTSTGTEVLKFVIFNGFSGARTLVGRLNIRWMGPA